jgi:hypothetical protein
MAERGATRFLGDIACIAALVVAGIGTVIVVGWAYCGRLSRLSSSPSSSG